MDKSGFAAFVNKKGVKIHDKLRADPASISKREGELLSELLDLMNFLDEKETFFDFEPILHQYMISLNAYYSKWVLSVLKKKVKLPALQKFAEDMKVVHDHFVNSFSESRLRYLRIAIYKKTK
ncbi:hypothetical protein [Pedobacter polaris]|nr:hypothetical protein [Pedobacter polaris]